MFPHSSQKYLQHRKHQLGRYELIPRVSPMRVDHRHASPVHGVNKAVDKGHWNRGPYPEKIYTQSCCSYRPWTQAIEFSLNFVPQMLYCVQIRTDGRPWHDSDVVLLENVPGGSSRVGGGIVPRAKIVYSVKSKDLIDTHQSRDAITSTWAKDNRSSFMTDPDGSPNHEALPTAWVSLQHTCISVTFTSSSPDRYSAIRRRNTEPTFIWE